jgi:hypothetical protein
MVNKEILEILKYLEPRKDYAIVGGFAQFAYTGVGYSPDIDIYAISQKAKGRMAGDMQDMGWKLKYRSKGLNRLEKRGTTFDIMHSMAASEIGSSSSVKINVYGHELNVISKEALFLTKLGRFSTADRTEEKRMRDLKTIIKLRRTIDMKKLRGLVSRLPDSYWRTGSIV